MAGVGRGIETGDAKIGVIEMDGAALFFGGPYGNLEATRAVLAAARAHGIPPQRIVCTGDLVAYCADPVATIDLVRDSGIHVVMGNCDEQLGLSAGDCGCGFPEGSACERLSAAWFAYADARVTPAQRKWLAGLPRRLDVIIAGQRLAVIHGTLDNISRFIFASTPALAKQRELEAAGCDGIIAGHCGLGFSEIIDGRLWHNAGVIGMPAHDGTPRVWYSILQPIDGGGIEISHLALDYDHAGAAAAMRQARLPVEYERALGDGMWPGCDVLPLAEIRAGGIPLDAGRVVWQPDPAARTKRRGAPIATQLLWPSGQRDTRKPLAAEKFKDPIVTAKGERRADVPLRALETLWFNTGTLCNITCRNCYIESSPKNDRLVYLTLEEVRGFLDEIETEGLDTREIGFTGGEPFMNPHMLPILDECLDRGFDVLVLTNAMRPMQRLKKRLLQVQARADGRLKMRVSLDHFSAPRHEEERGIDTFAPAIEGLRWLSENGFPIAVAGRTMWGESEAGARVGYGRLFAEQNIAIDASDPAALVLFPEMDEHLDVPEITTACWDILGKSPDDMMCSTSRMVVKRKDADKPVVLSCTLLAYEPQFEMGHTLREASRAVPLNHAHCAKFCVLGGASCTPAAKDGQPPAPPRSLADTEPVT